MQKTVGEWSPYEAVFRCQCGTISFFLSLEIPANAGIVQRPDDVVVHAVAFDAAAAVDQQDLVSHLLASMA